MTFPNPLAGTGVGDPLSGGAGSGITSGTGTVYKTRCTREGELLKTEIFIDLTGLHSMNTDGDIIGVDGGAANCHLGQITAAQCGTIIAGTVTCHELPAGGDPNIDLYSAVEATGAEDAAITGLTETALLNAATDWAAGDTRFLTAWPAAGEYLYLTQGDAIGTDADYTAGRLLITLWGTR